jgi:hypothetical protein
MTVKRPINEAFRRPQLSGQYWEDTFFRVVMGAVNQG